MEAWLLAAQLSWSLHPPFPAPTDKPTSKAMSRAIFVEAQEALGRAAADETTVLTADLASRGDAMGVVRRGEYIMYY